MPTARPFDPSFSLVVEANANLKKAKFRDRVRKLHEKETPLSEMVEKLGLGLTPEVQAILDRLSKKQVKAIRAATLAMLDQTGDHDMPLDCVVTETMVYAGAKVAIEVDDVIHVRPKPAKTPKT